MWLKHPDIAKRWAHEYPNQKNLPTYAHEDRDKKPDAEKEEKQSEFSAANAARDTLVAGGASTIGTTAGLAGAAALANRVGSPVLGNLFRNAAKESLLFFNPVRSFRLLRRLPRAAVLASNQLELSDRLIHSTIPKTFKGVTPKQINKATQAYKDVTRLQRQTQKYHTLHGELPGETLEKGIGVANGVMNLGVGGAVGLLPHLTGSASTPAPSVPQPASAFGKWAQVYQWPVLRTQAYLQPKTSENQESAEKKEAHMARNVTTRCNDYKNTAVQYIQSLIHKHANSAAVPVEIPHSEQPVSAGEESVSLSGPDQEGQLLGQLSKETCKPPVNETLHKLAVVLSQVLQQQIADEQAAAQGQEAQQVPQNVNMKQYAQPASATPLPMGMAQAQNQQMQAAMPGAAPQAQAPQAPAAPQKTANVAPMPAGPQATSPSAPPVGSKGIKPIKPLESKQLGPSTTPIQTFGALSTNGDWGNPNAGLGVPNSPETKLAGTPAWQRSAGKNEEGGLNEKGRKSYEREHGGNLKAPVTEKNPKGKAKKRQNSFCSRMCGMKRVNTGASTAKDPDSRINKSLRKWNCKCSRAMQFGAMLSQQSNEETKTADEQQPANNNSLGWAAAGLPAASLATGVPAGLYADNFFLANEAAHAKTDQAAWDKLTNFAKQQGVDVMHNHDVAARFRPKSLTPAPGPWWQRMYDGFKLQYQNGFANRLATQPGFYMPGNAKQKPVIGYAGIKTPWGTSRSTSASILAHELGHHMGGKPLAYTAHYSRRLAPLGTLGALYSGDETTSRNSAMAGTASMIPTLVSEVDASRRGANLMKNMKLSGRWRAFGGLPTYAAVAATPMAAHYGKKLFGGFTPSTPASTPVPGNKPA
jgi:hypothetical protein